jgi:hypothetical protein
MRILARTFTTDTVERKGSRTRGLDSRAQEENNIIPVSGSHAGGGLELMLAPPSGGLST